MINFHTTFLSHQFFHVTYVHDYCCFMLLWWMGRVPRWWTFATCVIRLDHLVLLGPLYWESTTRGTTTIELRLSLFSQEHASTHKSEVALEDSLIFRRPFWTFSFLINTELRALRRKRPESFLQLFQTLDSPLELRLS